MEQKITIPENWDIPASISDRIVEVLGTQRCLEAEGHLILILHKIPTTDSARRDLRMFWRSPDGTWTSNGLGTGIRALQRHLTEYNERALQLEEKEDSATSAEDFLQIRREVSPIYRSAQHMSATITRAYEMCPDDRGLLICRNLASTVVRTAELLKEDATHGLDFFMAKQAESQALAAHRLNLIAVIFFPILAFAAIFGMNLDHGFEHETPLLFWMVVVIGIVTGVVMKSLIFKAKRAISDEKEKGDEE